MDDRGPPADCSFDVPDAGEMALDTVASMLRSMAEFALEQERVDPAIFRQQAEGWAQHVIMAAPPPMVAPPPAPPEKGGAGSGRRDWQGVRQFVRDYCRSSAQHSTGVAADLRHVIWVFVRNFSQAFALDEQLDDQMQQQVARLEKLVEASAASELRREVLDVVGRLTQAFEERRHRQRVQMTTLGDTVRTLGDELESARREGEMDPLTGVFNRKAFDAYLDRTVEVFNAFRQEMCLLVIDVDNFKAINDSCGHAVGDQVLREVADAIGKVFLRKSDFVSRFGGDEFAVILRETPLANALPLAERVLSRVRAVRVKAGGAEVALTVSMGGAAMEPGDDARGWFERADRGLYGAKSAGRNRLAIGERAAAPPSP